jgi:putative Ig domain-containing protein
VGMATASLNEPYASAIAVVGGRRPYIFQLAAGDALPAGLKLDRDNGTITGSPTKEGESVFNVTVTDADGVTVEIPGRLTIERR